VAIRASKRFLNYHQIIGCHIADDGNRKQSGCYINGGIVGGSNRDSVRFFLQRFMYSVRIQNRHFLKKFLQNTRLFTMLDCVTVVNITNSAPLSLRQNIETYTFKQFWVRHDYLWTILCYVWFFPKLIWEWKADSPPEGIPTLT